MTVRVTVYEAMLIHKYSSFLDPDHHNMSQYLTRYTPVVELSMGPGRPPSPVFHRQGHLFEVAWVPVDKRRADRLVVIDHRLGLRGCLAECPSWRENPPGGGKSAERRSHLNRYHQRYIELTK